MVTTLPSRDDELRRVAMETDPLESLVRRWHSIQHCSAGGKTAGRGSQRFTQGIVGQGCQGFSGKGCGVSKAIEVIPVSRDEFDELLIVRAP
jgi:hypothetical protein